MQKEPIAYILNNIIAIFQAYLAAGRKTKATYDALKQTSLPEIENEITYTTFNSRLKPIMDTYEFLKSDKPVESEIINPEIENLESDLQAKDVEIDKINSEKVNLMQEVKRLNSIISNLYENLQEVNQVNHETDKPVSEVNSIKNNEVNLNQDKPENEVNAMINDILQRLERVEKAVFQSEVNVNQDKPINEVNVNQVNLFEDKPINEVNVNQDKPEKIKVGKWNIVKRGKAYRAYRNFGDKGAVKGVKAVYIGKEFTEVAAVEKITGKGFPID